MPQAPKTLTTTSVFGSRTPVNQTRVADAAMKLSDADLDAVVSSWRHCARTLWKITMSSNAITIPGRYNPGHGSELHQWLTTVDHKRLGIPILSACCFS
jgi:hypothetical protein